MIILSQLSARQTTATVIKAVKLDEITIAYISQSVQKAAAKSTPM